MINKCLICKYSKLDKANYQCTHKQKTTKEYIRTRLGKTYITLCNVLNYNNNCKQFKKSKRKFYILAKSCL